MKEFLCFLAGALVMRYIILNTPNYKAKEAEKLDQMRNNVHDLIKKYAPEADDAQVGDDVMATIPQTAAEQPFIV